MAIDTLSVVNKAQEPNPFEESFSSVTTKFKSYEPPSNNTMDYIAFNNHDSYSTLSTSEDSGDDYSYLPPYNIKNGSDTNSIIQYQYESRLNQQDRHQTQFVDMGYQPRTTRRKNVKPTNKTKRNQNTKTNQDEEKRRDFLERNRIAALKCRQRKKQWILNLQTRAEILTNDNDNLQLEVESLRNELSELKMLLMSHKDCPKFMEVSGHQNLNQSVLYQPQHTSIL